MENKTYDFEVLRGITACFIGDSLFAGHGIGKENSWINLLGEKYSMRYTNYGINGCTISACEGCSMPIVKRYVEMTEEDPDLVVFEGGRNDFNKGAVIGSVDEPDESTMCGAIAIIVKGLREKYPNAKLVAVPFWDTATVRDGRVSNDYVEAMIGACLALGVDLINSYSAAESGINMRDADFRAKYCYVPGDVCHLNEEGMKLAMPYFERELARLLSER